MSEHAFTFPEISSALVEYESPDKTFFKREGIADQLGEKSTATVTLTVDQIKGLIEQDGCVGLRLYFDYDNEKERGDVYLLGINQKGEMMASTGHRMFISSWEQEGADEIHLTTDTPTNALALNTVRMLERNKSVRVGFKASFSKEAVESLFEATEQITVSTVRLPHAFNPSFRSSALSSTKVGAGRSTSLVNLLPCPPNCAGGYPPQG